MLVVVKELIIELQEQWKRSYKMFGNEKIYTNAQYVAVEGENVSINVEIDGLLSCVPIADDNGDYAELMRLVKIGDLTIKDAD